MDSQHRHELQENDLAHWLERQIEALKPQLPLILGGIVAVAVAIWGIGLLRSSNESAQFASWDGFAIAVEGPHPNLVFLEQVAQDHEGSDAAEWADITLADGKLFIAAQSYFLNRESADTSIAEAKEIYQRLRGASSSMVRDRASFGLARAAEIEGDLESAKELYGSVTGSFKEVASKRAEELAKENVAADFQWLVTAKPAVRSPSGPGIPGQVPDFSVDAIATPDAEEAEEPVDTRSGIEALDEILRRTEQEQAEREAAEADLQPSDAEEDAEPSVEAADEAEASTDE